LNRVDTVSATIFISYSSKDDKLARTVCTALENRGLTCWIANRDVAPGENFQEAIVRAIRNAKVMVLVFTENANNSDEIKKELALASRYKLVVIPARAEDVLPSDAFELELSTRQWINLFDNWEHGIEGLSARITSLTGIKSSHKNESPIAPAAPELAHNLSAVRSSSTPSIGTTLKARLSSNLTTIALLLLAFVGLGVVIALTAYSPGRQSLGSSPPIKQSTKPSEPIAVFYREPSNPKLVPTMDRLKKRAYLEDLREFLTPVRWPLQLTIRTQQCGVVNAFYNPTDRTVVICYELVDWIESIATPSENTTREDIVLGAITQWALHDVSHALIHILGIPIMGDEEVAADQLSVVMMLEFNADLARRTLPATVAYHREFEDRKNSSDLLRTTVTQRFHNHLCLLYGADQKTFGHLVEEKLLPSLRARMCQHEYRQMKHAFDAFILPHIDQAALKKPRARPWIN
jgi:hypothetical protein